MELFMPSFPKCSFPSFFKNYLLIYFWLCWVFIAAHGLSLVAAGEGYTSLLRTGFSVWCWLPLWSTSLSAQASGVEAHGLSDHGAQAWLPCSLWDLPGQGIKPMSPALAGGFLTTWTTREVLLSFF